jgi:RimJ/RimL family protein N-acetyltransferase
MNTPPYRIVTPRTVVRCYNPADAEALHAAIAESLDHLRAMLPWAHAEPQSLDWRIDWLRSARAKFDRDEDYGYGIFSPDESRILGAMGLHTRIGPDALEIGYWIHAREAGKGIATEVAAALTRVAFELCGVRWMRIRCDVDNLASAAVPRKLGYTHEATLRGRRLTETGASRDLMEWSLFREDYPATAAALAELQAFDAAGRRVL